MKLMINNLLVDVNFDKRFIQEIALPLLTTLQELYEKKQRRIVVFLAAPPATGKSTLVTFLENLSKETSNTIKIQSLGMDGFHHRQEYIKQHHVFVHGEKIPMIDVKGCPETFDFSKLHHKISCIRDEDILWPRYNRKLHDVEEDKILVDKDIILIEGNYLLLKEEPWSMLKEMCDYSIFIKADEDLLKKRLIMRKIQGGSQPHKAIQFYESSDKVNVWRTQYHSHKADLTLYLNGQGELIKQLEQ